MLNGECILYGINGNVSRFEVYEDGRLHGNFIDFYVNSKKRAEGKMS